MNMKVIPGLMLCLRVRGKMRGQETLARTSAMASREKMMENRAPKVHWSMNELQTNVIHTLLLRFY